MAAFPAVLPAKCLTVPQAKRLTVLPLLLALLLTAIICPGAAAAVQDIDPAAPSQELSSHMGILEDPEGQLSIDDVIAMPPESFRSLDSYPHGTSMGIQKPVFWIKMELNNPADAYLSRVIQYRQTWTHDVQFFVVVDNQVSSQIFTGTSQPFDRRPLPGRHFAFPVQMHKGVNTYYFRLQSYMPLMLDFTCYQSPEYESQINTDTGMLWMFYGALLVLIILNILVFLLSRTHFSLSFILFMSAFFLFLSVFDGTGFKYLWPDNTWWEVRSFPIFMIMAIISYALFFGVYTDLMRRHRWFVRIVAFTGGLGLLACFYIMLSRPGYHLAALQPIFLAVLLAILAFAVWFWHRYRERHAVFFLGSYSLLMVVTAINALQGIGLLSEDMYSHYGMHAGIICVALVLNLGMADRIKQAVNAQNQAEQQLRSQYEDLQQMHAELQDSLARTETLNDQLVFSQEELLAAHERLGHQERRIQTIFERAPICMVIVDGQGVIKEANQMSSVMFGYEAAELVGMKLQAFMLDEPAEELQAKLDAVVSQDISSFNIERIYAGRKGEQHWGDTYVSALYNQEKEATEIIVAISDISEKKAADEARAASESKYRAVVENAGEVITVIQDQNIKFANPHIERVLGRSREEMTGREVLEYIHPDDRAGIMEHNQRVLDGDTPSSTHIFRLIDINGQLHYMESLGVLIDWEGRPANLVFSLDVTERLLAEEEKGKLQTLLAGFFDSMPSVLVGVSPQGRVNLWNRAAISLTGIERSEALDQPVELVLPVIARLQRELQRALRRNSLQSAERMTWMRNGEKTFLDAVIYPVNTEELAGVVVRIDDVTDKVHLEEMLVQTEKMLSVGGLAAGMAHEINNPLGGILQGTQNIKRRLSTNLPINHSVAQECGTTMETIISYLERRNVPDIIEGIRESGARAASIVHNMLQFSRLSQSMKEPRHLHELAERTLRLAASDYDLERRYDFKHIEIVRNFDLQIPEVYCIATEIEQVILNLLKNAAQAVFLQAEHPRITISTCQEDNWAVISVEDNGPGMDENTRRKVFEPFFTTKEPGSGTGLGLSVSYFIVTNNHNGQMMVESSPGQGARFIVRLPVASPIL